VKEFYDMVKAVQKRASKRTVTKKHIAEALGCYANAVSFCDLHGLPYPSIRVQLCGGYGFHNNPGAMATLFEYDGKTWTAYRAQVGGQSNKNKMGYSLKAWVETDEEHKTKLLSLNGCKKKGQKLWEADIPKQPPVR
jgi:hypothetical protein